MKKIILSIIITCLLQNGFSQLKIGPGTHWITTGGASVVLEDINLVNDGTIGAGTGSFKFTGTINSTIGGNTVPPFYILEIAKTNSAKVLLNRNISVSYSINFISGQLDLNGNNTALSTGANIAGETETNRITGANGGFAEITQNLNSPNGSNPGGLGASITSSANLGLVTIRRGHVPQSGTGLVSSINRYYSIVPTNNSDLNATLRLKYFDAELNGQNENIFAQYQSADGGANWSNLSKSSNSTNSNYVEKTGVASFALQTLSNDIISGPVGGLVFTGTRKKPTEVKLNWTTQTETSLSGYKIQRRLDNEIDFSDRAFVNSLAPGGTSSSSLSYQNTDANSYNGTSHYRLKIVALDNTNTYSDIISIAPKAKGGGGNPNNLTATDSDPVVSSVAKSSTSANEMNKKITVGPNPNYGNFWFTVNGIEKETVASLFTVDGKMVKQFRVVNMMQQPVNNLSSGIYILKVHGFDGTKIIVQGDSRKGSNNSPATDNKNLD